MRNNKNGLDEMQKERRNSIGNQTFMLMFYAIFFDCGLYGAGIRWLNYPANVTVIISVCMGIYLIRLISLNAYLPPKAQNRKTAVTLILVIIFSITLAMAALNLFGQFPEQVADNTNNNFAMIFFIVSAVGLIAALTVAAIKKANNRDDKDDKDD